MFKQQGGFWWYFVGIIIMFLLLFYLAQLIAGKTSIGIGNSNTTVKITSTGGNKTVTPTKAGSPSASKGLDITKDYYAEIITNLGTIKIDLFERNTPNTVANFINLTNSGYYNGTKFIKLIPGVAVQGGSKDGSATGSPGYTIPDEINWDSLDYNEDLRVSLRTAGYSSAKKIASIDIDKYALVMVDPIPNSAGSQFMILLSGRENSTIEKLRGKVTVFAKIIEDTSTIQKIASVQASSIGTVTIQEIKIYTR